MTGLVGLPLLLFLLLLIPSVQKKILGIAVGELTRITGTHISVGDLHFRPFNHISLGQVYVEDRSGDTLLYANRLSVDFNLLRLLDNELKISSAGLDDFLVNVQKDSLDGEFNFQFLIDAFASTDTVKKPERENRLVVNLGDLSLSRGRINYRVADQPAADEGFDPNHISVADFHADFSLGVIDPKRLDVKLRSLSFREQSGFVLSGLKANVVSHAELISIEDLVLQLPRSEVRLPSATIDYTGSELASLIDSAVIDLQLNASIYPEDLKAFYSPLKDMGELLTVETRIEGRLPAVHFQDMRLAWGDALYLQGNASIEDYLRWQQALIDLQINDLRFSPERSRPLVAALTGQALPEIVRNLGDLSLSVSAKGSLPLMDIRMDATSRPGRVELQGRAGYTVDTGSSVFDLNVNVPNYNLFLLLRNAQFGNAGFRLQVRGGINERGRVNARAQLALHHFTFNQYRYNRINANAAYIGNNFSIDAVSRDTNALFVVKAAYAAPPGRKSEGSVYAKLDHVRLHKLNLLPDSAIREVFAEINGQMTGNTLDEYSGAICIDSLSIGTERGTFRQNRVEISLNDVGSDNKSLEIRSDLVNGSISGHLSLETIATSINNTLHRMTPSLIAYRKPSKKFVNSVEMQLSVEDTESLSEVFTLPFTIKKPATIEASYQEADQYLSLQANLPVVAVGADTFCQTKLDIHSDRDGEVLSAVLQTQQAGADTTFLKLNAVVENDSIGLALNADNEGLKLDGAIALSAKFMENKQKEEKNTFPDMHVWIHPTEIQFKNQSFNISPAEALITGDKYEIRDFRITHSEDGNVSVHGIVSSYENDSLMLVFEQLNLAPFLEMIQYKGVGLGAIINGGVAMKNLLQSPFFITNDLTVNEIRIEDKKIGDMKILSAWSDRYQGVILNISLYQENQRISTIKGFALPFKDSLSVNVDVKELELQWMQPFVKGLLSDLDGRVGVSLAAHGRIRKPALEGFLYLYETSFRVEMTNVSYSLSDSIYIDNRGLDFQRFTIRDSDNNTATLTGTVRHENFETYQADLRLNARNFLLLNNPQETDSMFYGTLRAQASVAITGTEKGLNVEGSIRSGTAGRIFVQLPDTRAEAARHQNIVFINTPEEKDTLPRTVLITPPPISLPVRVSVDVELTPAVQLGVIFNRSTNDVATISGNGNLRFTYNVPGGDMRLLGDYTIEEGRIVVSLRNIARREFAIQRGSRVTFRGDPMATTFNITAVYSLRADLATLDQSFANELSNTRVNTNAVLNLSGNLDKMNITYSLAFPDLDESVQRKVDNLIFSDEIRIKQVAYLLALGRFFPPEGSMSVGSGTSIWTSLASSTLSSQLNNLLSGVLSENWTVGTSLRSNDDNFSDVEMDLNVSTSLFNNRLIVNTNLGFRHNTTQDNNITGDFMAIYKLTRNGALRLKAYNVTNEEYFRTSLTTQGLGIMYVNEASTFRGLFRETLGRISRLRYLPRMIRANDDQPKKEDESESQTIEKNEDSNSK